jgi:drug/metabolite transporter (DMT)-like permease
VTALLAISSAAIIGGVDFFGGFISRRLPPVRVAALVQVTGLLIAVPVALLVDWDRVTSADVAWSLVGGVAVGFGLGLFYTALARGLISLVAPVTGAVGASIPVVWDFARGEVPGALAVTGIVLAIAAIVIVSFATVGRRHDDDVRAVAMGVCAGVLFGVFYVAYSLPDPDAGLWPVPILRVGAAVALVGCALVMTRGVRLPTRTLSPIGALGLLEVVGAVLLLEALQRGPVAVAAVLGSLYPVTTVLLAAAVLHERLTRSQAGGVLLALVAIVLVSTG